MKPQQHITIKKEDLRKPRRSWAINPRTRIKESQKGYRRPRAKREVHRSVREGLEEE